MTDEAHAASNDAANVSRSDPDGGADDSDRSVPSAANRAGSLTAGPRDVEASDPAADTADIADAVDEVRRTLLTRLQSPVRRITKVQAVALVLFTMLTLGPVIAFVVIFRADTTARPELVAEASVPPPGGVLLVLTVTNVNPVASEMGTRVRVVPDASLLVAGGGLKNPLTVASNDIQGRGVVTMAVDDGPSPLQIVTAMTSGSVSRYPFDRYEGRVQLIVSQQVNGKRSEVPTALIVESGVTEMAVTGSVLPDDLTPVGRVVDLQFRRSAPTLVFTTWMMCLWWALSISAVFTVWSVAIWRSTVPAWAYGFFVGVLFALTPLRSALPGSPPYGVLVDWVSFYWAIVIVGIGLMMLVAYFIRDAREQSQALAHEESERVAADEAAAAARAAGGLILPEGTTPVG